MNTDPFVSGSGDESDGGATQSDMNGSDDAASDESNRRVVDLVADGEYDGSAAILVLGPMEALRKENTCIPFFQADTLDDKNVLFVSLTHSSEDRLRMLREHGNGSPANVGVVTAGDRFASSKTETRRTDDAMDVTIRSVSDPSDLPKLGITISKFTREWDTTDRETIVCFHSVSVLLQYAELRRVFRFLHVLNGRFSAADAKAHYHMNSDAHDRQTIATLFELFDTVIEFDRGGDLTYRR